MNKTVPFRRVTVALACALGVPLTHGAAWDWNNSTALWTAAGAWTPDEFPLSAPNTLLRFGGTGNTPYVSTYDFAAPFVLHGLELNSTATVTETISSNAGGTLNFVTDGSTNPQLTQLGSGAFDLALGLEVANPLTLGGAGTGLVTLSGVITGGGGLSFAGGNWRLTNTANSFTGGFTVGTSAFVELAPPGAFSILPGPTSLVGSNALANPLTINGGTLKVTTTGNITFGNNRPLVFGTNGGILDLRNSGVVGGGNMAGGDNDLALTLNNTGGNVAVIKFNGGENGISTNSTNSGDWSSGNNTLRIESYGGTGPLRLELENGATFQNRPATVNVPVTVRGVVGGDPTSGPNASVNANLSKTTGRMIFDVTGTHNYAQGLTLEGALQLSAAGAARALDGNVVLAPGAYVAFNGRGTGTALGAPITAAGTNTADTQHPLYVGAGGNDTLTIQPGAVAVFDSRIRHEQGNNNAVLLNARAVIRGGGELRIAQSLSRATASLAAGAGQINTNSTTSLVGHHILDGDIQGEGSTANEALFSIYLPAAGGADSNGDQVPDTGSFGDLGGVVFRSNLTATTAGTNGTDLIINGTGFGGLRVEGRARPNLLFATSGTVSDPVSTADKVSNLLTADRLSRVTGTGGYLTPAPLQNTFVFPVGGDWAGAVSVGLKVVDHNTTGVDVSLGALSGFNHNLAVDAGATLDLGAAAPFLIDNNAFLLGKGNVISSGSISVNVGASIAPGLDDLATFPVTTGTLTIDGSLSIGVQVTAADLLAVNGNLTLGGTLAVAGSFGTQDVVIASYSGALAGTFTAVTGLSPLFSVDYGTGTNGVIKLVYNTTPSRVWEGLPSATWSVGGANWKNGGIFVDGDRVRFDGTAAGSTTVTISGSDVKPLETVVNADTKNYTIVSSAGAALAGAGPLTKTGAMILNLLGPAAYTGGTTISAGTIALGSDNALPDVGTISIAAGATLNTAGHTDTVGDISVEGSVTGGGTLSVNALAIAGSGTFSPNLVLNGSISKTGGPGTFTAPIDFNTGTRTINVEAASTFTITGTLSNGGLDKTGPGDLVLAPVAPNQHLGGTIISNGKLIAQVGAIPADSPLTVNGGTLEVAGAQSLVLSSLSGTGGTITGANGITLNQSGTTTFAGSINGVTSVNMNGAGQITLSGNSTYSGGLFANSGRVILTSSTAGGSGIVTINPGSKLGSGAGLTSRVELKGGTFFGVGGPASVASNDLFAAPGTATTISLNDPDAPGTRSEMRVLGTLKGSGDLNVVISSNAPHPDGGVGFRLLGTAASDYSGTITMGQSTKFETQVGQAGPFSPAGTGKLVFTAGDFFGGLAGNYSQYNVRSNFAGTAVIGNNVEVVGTGFVNMNMAGSGGGGTVVGSTSVLGNLRIGSQTLGVNKNGTPTQILEFTSVTLTGGDATFAPTTIGFGASGAGDLRLGPISELVPGSGIVLNGASTLTLAATNTYTGTTRLESGTLMLAASGALPVGGALVVNGGAVDFGSGFISINQTVGSLSGTGGSIMNTDGFSTRSFVVAQSTNTAFGGSISGNLALTKTGAGELTLNGAVSSTDVFSIEGGSVKANGSVTPPIVVKAGGNISGSGILGTVAIQAGGLLTPGDFSGPNPSGILTASEVSFTLGAAMDVSLAKAIAGAQPVASDYASLKVTGSINVTDAELDLSLGSGIEMGDIFTIILNEGPSAVTGTFFEMTNGSFFQTQGQSFQISYFDDASTPGVFELAGGNDVSLLAVPEPASCALLLGGLALVSAGRYRRRA